MSAPTVEELEALAMGAIVLTGGGTCFVKMGHDGLQYGGEWRSPYKIPSSRPTKGEFVDSDYVSKVAARVLYAGEGAPLGDGLGVPKVDAVRKVISDAFYGARNDGQTMEWAADVAAARVLVLIEVAGAEQ